MYDDILTIVIRFMGGFTTALFVFDFFGNFHLDSMKNILEVSRYFPLLNLGGKKFEKNLQAGCHVTSKVR